MATESGHGGRTKVPRSDQDAPTRPERRISGLLPLSNRPQAAPAAHYIQPNRSGHAGFQIPARSLRRFPSLHPGLVLDGCLYILFELLPGGLIVHKILGADLAVDVVMAHQVIFIQLQLGAQGRGQLHQGFVGGLVVCPRLVRVTGLDGDGVFPGKMEMFL